MSAIQLYQGHQGELLLEDCGELRPIKNQEVALQYLQIQRAFEQGAIAATQLHQASQYLLEKEREAYGLAVSAMNTAIQASDRTNTVLVEENRSLREQNHRLMGLAEKLVDRSSGGDTCFSVEIQSGQSWGWQEVAPIFWFIMLIVGLSGIISYSMQAAAYHQRNQAVPTIQRSL